MGGIDRRYIKENKQNRGVGKPLIEFRTLQHVFINNPVKLENTGHGEMNSALVACPHVYEIVSSL